MDTVKDEPEYVHFDEIQESSFEFANHFKYYQDVSFTEIMNNCSPASFNWDPNIPTGDEMLIKLPEKSGKKYLFIFNRFKQWAANQGAKTLNEQLMLQYFKEQLMNYRASTVLCDYWIIRTLLLSESHVDISQFPNLLTYLKQRAEADKSTKIKTFNKEEVTRFLVEADDKKFLFMKAALIVGIAGDCRRDELANIMVEDVQDENHYFKMKVKDAKTKDYRHFLVTSGSITGSNLVEIVRKYAELRPSSVFHNRFFIQYLNGKCTKQPVGINTFGTVPKKIARYLNLPNADQFTGHCFRKSSSEILGDSVSDLLIIQNLNKTRILNKKRKS